MDEPKPSIETPDDTPVGPDMTDSDLAGDRQDPFGVDARTGRALTGDALTGNALTGESSVELAIETLAGVDAADAPDLADEVATRLRAQLSDN